MLAARPDLPSRFAKYGIVYTILRQFAKASGLYIVICVYHSAGPVHQAALQKTFACHTIASDLFLCLHITIRYCDAILLDALICMFMFIPPYRLQMCCAHTKSFRVCFLQVISNHHGMDVRWHGLVMAWLSDNLNTLVSCTTAISRCYSCTICIKVKYVSHSDHDCTL